MNKQRFEIQRLWVNNFEEQRKETARKITRKFELGSGTIYDIARSDLKVSDSRINLQQIELQMNNATSVLQEFNLPENLTLPTVADRVVLSELDMEDQLKEHPLLIEAQAFVDASALDLDAAKSNRSPIIQLELSRSDRLFSAIDKHNADYSGLITLTQNFYTGGSEGARLTQSNSRYIQARAELDSKKKGLRTALMRAGYDVNNLYSALELRKAGVDASMATFASTAKLFEVNRGTLIDLQQSEDDLYDKVKLLIDNWFDVSIAYYRYLHVNNMLTTRFLAPRSVVQGNIKPNS
jgi:outer membrane protein TolC